MDRKLALMAEGRVDLREVFNTMEPDADYSSKVADALEESGVPASMLKGLVYDRSARRPTPGPAIAQGSKPGIGASAAGRTITPTGHGASLGP